MRSALAAAIHSRTIAGRAIAATRVSKFCNGRLDTREWNVYVPQQPPGTAVSPAIWLRGESMRALPVRVGRIRYVLRFGAWALAVSVSLACAGTAVAGAPPGRAYERVTPAGKGGGDIVSAWNARPAGGGVSYAGFSAFDDSRWRRCAHQRVLRRPRPERMDDDRPPSGHPGWGGLPLRACAPCAHRRLQPDARGSARPVRAGRHRHGDGLLRDPGCAQRRAAQQRRARPDGRDRGGRIVERWRPLRVPVGAERHSGPAPGLRRSRRHDGCRGDRPDRHGTPECIARRRASAAGSGSAWHPRRALGDFS